MDRVYKGIEFAKDYNESFADFKDRFASNHIFKNMRPDEREAELKAAYKIAIGKNGNNTGTIKKVEETEQTGSK